MLRKLLHLNTNQKGALIIILVVIVLVGYRPLISKSTAQNSGQIISRCESREYRPSCYDKEIPKLMDQGISMEQAFEITKMVQRADPSFAYCHVLGHELSTKEVDRDPDHWKEVIARCPSGLCSNGCLHGALQARFRADNLNDEQIATLKSDLNTICESRTGWNPTKLAQSSCYHGLGHLNMYLTRADLSKSVALCQEEGIKPDGRDYRPVCLDGVFMQVYQPLEPEDLVLISSLSASSKNPANFCGQFSGLTNASCLGESWPLSLNQIKTPSGFISFCQAVKVEFQPRCMDNLAYILMVQFHFDSTAMTNFCASLPANFGGSCLAGGATRLMDTDYTNAQAAISLCQSSSQSDPSETCFHKLSDLGSFNFSPGSSEITQFCQALPEKWRKRCFATT